MRYKHKGQKNKFLKYCYYILQVTLSLDEHCTALVNMLASSYMCLVITWSVAIWNRDRK